MKKCIHIAQLNTKNALQQSIIAIVLMTGFPLLSILFMGTTIHIDSSSLSPHVASIILICTLVLAVAGFIILLKFPRNIIKLRQYISDVAKGILPDRISLLDTNCSDDLQYIEAGLNAVLQEMRHRIELAEQNQRMEHELREQIEQQQRTLIHAERHRAMIQSLGAACHHIGQPAAILKMRLCLMKKITHTDVEAVQIEECEKDIIAILTILDRLKTVSEFRTVPYISNDNYTDTEILAI